MCLEVGESTAPFLQFAHVHRHAGAQAHVGASGGSAPETGRTAWKAKTGLRSKTCDFCPAISRYMQNQLLQSAGRSARLWLPVLPLPPFHPNTSVTLRVGFKMGGQGSHLVSCCKYRLFLTPKSAQQPPSLPHSSHPHLHIYFGKSFWRYIAHPLQELLD